jgi:hypothetical protein
MQFGSAGLSSLRDKALTQPALPTAIKVNPPPVVVVDKSTLQLAATTQYSSVWQAEQARSFTNTLNPTLKQVAEIAELTT